MNKNCNGKESRPNDERQQRIGGSANKLLATNQPENTARGLSDCLPGCPVACVCFTIAIVLLLILRSHLRPYFLWIIKVYYRYSSTSICWLLTRNYINFGTLLNFISVTILKYQFYENIHTYVLKFFLTCNCMKQAEGGMFELI